MREPLLFLFDPIPYRKTDPLLPERMRACLSPIFFFQY